MVSGSSTTMNLERTDRRRIYFTIAYPGMTGGELMEELIITV